MAITTLNSLAIPAGTIVESDLSYPLTNFSSTGIDDNAASTAVTIDSSQRVGIGTASPGATLEVAGPARTSNGYQIIDSGSVGRAILTLSSDNVVLGTGTTAGSRSILFETESTERMRITSSGNVGIGTTSPANNSLHIEKSGTARLRLAEAGVRSWDIEATSGAWRVNNATNSIEAMRIDLSGNVGIGTTSPSEKLVVGGVNAGSGSGEIAIRQEVTANTVSAFNEIRSGVTSGTNPYMAFAVRETSSPFATVERVRIDSSGLVGIGTDSPLTYIAGNVTQTITDASSTALMLETTSTNHVWYLTNDTTNSNALRFVTAGRSGSSTSGSSERMRIDSSGNLLVGCTTNGGPGGVSVQPSASVGAPQVIFNRSATTATSDVMLFRNNTITVGRIQHNNTSTTYATSSDQRLKENIVDAPAGNIDAIRVRSFDWKADGSHQTYGMIAQELVDVAPEAVSQGETEDDMWGVDYSKLIPMMIKEIQDLKAEVAALKGA